MLGCWIPATLPLAFALDLTPILSLIPTLTPVLIVTNSIRSLGLRLFKVDLRLGVGRCEGRTLGCAGQRAAQLSIFATLQRRRTAAALLLITSLALETARGVGSRGQLKRSGGLARVAGTALHASGECLVRRAFHLCKKQRGLIIELGCPLVPSHQCSSHPPKQT